MSQLWKMPRNINSSKMRSQHDRGEEGQSGCHTRELFPKHPLDRMAELLIQRPQQTKGTPLGPENDGHQEQNRDDADGGLAAPLVEAQPEIVQLGPRRAFEDHRQKDK